jgi:copper chaperone CopZ
MQTKTVVVPGISCNHCVRTIQNEVAEVDGVVAVKADAASKRVTVQWDDKTNWETIKAKLVEIDYPPQE